MSDQVFDEEISLKRFVVALKRADWRMFEQAIVRLDQEIKAGSPFSRHQDWQAFLRAAGEHEELPESLVARLREGLGRLLAVETRAGTPTDALAPAEGDHAVALVVGWQGGLTDPAVREAFASWLTAPGSPPMPARSLLSRWLGEGAGLGAIAHRANLALAAAGAGLVLADPPWVDMFYAGLAHALGTQAVPPLTCLADALRGVSDATVVLADPGLAWERMYDGLAGLELVKLGGSIDLFTCARCHHAVKAGGGVQPLSVACPACGMPAWPLILPPDQPSWLPPAGLAARQRAADRLRRAATWVLVEPPAPGGDLLATWLAGCLTPGKRILVLDSADPGAWQAFLAEFAARAVVTSRGPSDEVLAFLLHGGVPELEPTRAEDGAPARFAAKKKRR